MKQETSRLLFYLNTLYEFTHEISGHRNVSDILTRLLRIMIGTGIVRGIALSRAAGESAFEVAAQEHLDPSATQHIQDLLALELTDDVTNKTGIVSLPPAVDAPTTLTEVLAAAEMATAMAMHVPSRLTTVIGLGPLLTGTPVAGQQIQLLEALAKHTEVALGNAILYQGLIQENRQLRKVLDQRYQFDNIVGKSPQMQAVYERVEQAIDYPNYSVLVTGESGTGKELIAGAIHHHSARNGEFVPINCAVGPAELVESQLFGHEKGAFSGADRAKPGLFERAEGGTLFLDEIGEMPMETQAKLLRVLQEKKVRRVGGLSEIPVDVRVIAATNRDVGQAIESQRFREDLSYRFVMRIEIPPLRERKEDIPLLVDRLLQEIGEENGQPAKMMSTEGLQALQAYHWPANVRGLQNTLVRAFIRAKGEVIQLTDISPDITPSHGTNSVKIPSQLPLKEAADQFRRRMIREALERQESNITKAAHELGVSRQNLQNMMRRLKIKAVD